MRKIYKLILWMACLFALYFYFSIYTATVTISNESGVEIISLQVGISEPFWKPKTINNLKNGESASLTFHGLSDSQYVLNGTLADGGKIRAGVGYLTNGMDFNDTVVIHEDGKVEIKPGPQ